MNDSPYGLTASVWTNAETNPESQDAFLKLVDELHTGTVFLNRRVGFGAVQNDS
jgi:acyl-CoA reductase-like NAD-dependent aldehyde dehydrogenase